MRFPSATRAWFGLCAAGQLIAYLGYGLALRATAGVDNGVALSLPTSLAVVSVGFGPMFSANTSGGFSVDYRAATGGARSE